MARHSIVFTLAAFCDRSAISEASLPVSHCRHFETHCSQAGASRLNGPPVQVLLETELAKEVARALENATPKGPAGGLADLNFRLLTEAHTKARQLPGVR